MNGFAWRGTDRSGNAQTIVIHNPTITERAARVLAAHFRPIGNWMTGQSSPRAPGGSIPQGRTVGYSGRNDYQQLQQRLGRRTYMAGDSHGSHSSSSGAGGTVLAIGAGIFLACLGIPLLFMGLNNVTGGQRANIAGNTGPTEVVHRIVLPSGNTVVTADPTRVTTIIQGAIAAVPPQRFVTGGAVYAPSAQPDPEAVLAAQRAAGNVLHMPNQCAGGFARTARGTCAGVFFD